MFFDFDASAPGKVARSRHTVLTIDREEMETIEALPIRIKTVDDDEDDSPPERRDVRLASVGFTSVFFFFFFQSSFFPFLNAPSCVVALLLLFRSEGIARNQKTLSVKAESLELKGHDGDFSFSFAIIISTPSVWPGLFPRLVRAQAVVRDGLRHALRPAGGLAAVRGGQGARCARRREPPGRRVS